MPMSAIRDRCNIDGILRRYSTQSSPHTTVKTDLVRYMRQLVNRDIALDRSMIPLGSCTMKLNAATEMEPVSWPEFARIHPFAPVGQTVGYQRMIDELERW